ncbi:hypothetical protein GIB67_031426 [Kingdonia uniflora]|uniref:Aminotransferase class I/classII large domain-containing protein n=1 Tax=Kingdonia uniflora TaxID=39325 RepID=A0A7J7MBD7_9MAGN|nr:hypothetical protein GIB67_031426 [Kingdonia uniflora]
MGNSVSFNPSQIVLTAGATPTIEILSFCLADTLEMPFLSPRHITHGLEAIPVPFRSVDNFGPSINALDRAFNQAKKRGLRHEEFVSMAEILEIGDFDRNKVHILYGLSKDLSLSGFRVGVIYTEKVLIATKRLTRFSSISLPAQRLLISLLLDTRSIHEFLETSKERLYKMFTLFVEGLKKLRIVCTRNSGGFYYWADMSRLIRSYSEKGELELWDKLLNITKINVTPGSSCHCIKLGWFQYCFTTLTEDDIPVISEWIKKVA